MANIPERYAADREKLAAELRMLRQERFPTGTAAARALGWSQSKVSKIESGAVLPSAADVERLLDLCRTPFPRRAMLLDLVAGLHGTVESNRIVLRHGASHKQRRIAQVEAESAELHYYAPAVVPGLLQTGEYMRLIFSAELEQPELGRSISARMERQQALYDQGRHFTFILHEDVLRWGFLSQQARAAQIGHILTLSGLGNVAVGIMAPDAEIRDIPLHGFEVFDDRLVTIGLEHATITVTEPRDVATYVRIFSHLAAAAAFGDEARHVLTRLLAG